MYKYESLTFGNELRHFFRTNNLPEFIEERFDEVFDGISRSNRSYIMATLSDFIKSESDYWTYLWVNDDEPEQDAQSVNEFLDLLDGYCLVYKVIAVYKANQQSGEWGIKRIDN